MATQYMLHVNENCESLDLWWAEAVKHLASCPTDAQCIFEEGVSKCSVDDKTLEAFEKWAARFEGWDSNVHQDESEPCNPVRATVFWYEAHVYSMTLTFLMQDMDLAQGRMSDKEPDTGHLEELAHELTSKASDDVGILDFTTNITAMALDIPDGLWVVTVALTLVGEGYEPKTIAEVLDGLLSEMGTDFVDGSDIDVLDRGQHVAIGSTVLVMDYAWDD